MNSYDVVIFHLMKTHPPIEHSVTIHILLMAHGVGGDGMVGGFMEWVSGWWGGQLEGSLGGWMCGGVVGGGVHGGVDGWRLHGVGAYTHPPRKSYNVKIFNFMNTHPSNISKESLCHYAYTLDGSWGGWWWGGWLEGSWHSCVCGCVGGGWWWGGWRVHGVGGSGVDGWRIHGVVLWVVVGGWLEGS